MQIGSTMKRRTQQANSTKEPMTIPAIAPAERPEELEFESE